MTPPDLPDSAAARALLVDNPDDPTTTVHHLARLAAGAGCAVLRPTPGPPERTVLARDMLAALGKNPVTMAREILPRPELWDLACAWAADGRTREVVVDRADSLTASSLTALARLARDASARLWLMWSSPQPHEPGLHAASAAGLQIAVISAETMRTLLPADPPGSRQHRAPPAGPRWPHLAPAPPLVDFPFFLAACRDRLNTVLFTHTAEIFHTAADHTDTWLDQHTDLLPTARLGPALTAWLRDVHLGPLTAIPALIALRATQTALFDRAIHLTWRPAALGHQPEQALPGDLTRQRAERLTGLTRTDHAAAFALSLHLNHPADFFGCWSLDNLTPDATALAPATTHRRHDPAYTSTPRTGQGPFAPAIPCQDPVHLPDYASGLLAAHRALRRRQRADGNDALFTHPRGDSHDVTRTLDQALVRVRDRHAHTDLPWLHTRPFSARPKPFPGPPNPHSWLAHRALTLTRLEHAT